MELISLLFFPLFFGPIRAYITCDKQTFIKTGLQYSDCEKEALEHFPDHIANPCPLVEHVASNCAEITKDCFDDRGWQRGLQMYVDLAIIKYQQMTGKQDLKYCNIFNATLASGVNVTYKGVVQKLPHELCSIEEEAALFEEIQICFTEAENQLVLGILNSHSSLKPPPITTLKEEFETKMCSNLNSTYETCISEKLPKCITEKDLPLYKAYFLEGIKLNSALVSTKFYLSNAQEASLLNCPIFQETSDATEVEILISVVTVLTILLILSIGAALTLYIIRNLEKTKAFLARQPYEEFPFPESTRNVSEVQSV